LRVTVDVTDLRMSQEEVSIGADYTKPLFYGLAALLNMGVTQK